ncbi:MAG TPA: sporulation protein, partial [Marinobacter sp.]|nr:sporulation protein [Marinobacter sp.]
METPFFPDAMRHHALETLRHLCGFGDLGLVLVGAVGSGKTRILAELVRAESSRLEFHTLRAVDLTSSEALARHLLSAAHRSIDGTESARDAVYGFFRWSETRVRKGRRMVLLLDDADQVPPELVRLIFDAFRASNTSAAAVPVFAGTETLMESLASAEETAGLHRIDLPPLTRREVEAYLHPRVHKAGGDPGILLNQRMLVQLHQLSQGNFGRLRRIAPAVWLDIAGASAGRRRALSGLTPMSLRWPALALVLLGVSWLGGSPQHDGAGGG